MAQSNLSGQSGRALVLAGFMGAGKSSSARALADRALDSDRMIEQETGVSVERLFERDGEAAFRELEERVMLEAIQRAANGEARGVLSIGGGALSSTRVRQELKRHTVVLLDADAETCWQRVKSSSRPLARDRNAFLTLFESRRELYGNVADAFVPSDGVHQLRQALPSIQKLASCPSGTRMVWAASASGSYPVFIGEGILGAEFLRPDGRFVLVSDLNVARLYGDGFKSRLAQIEMDPGEEAKTLESLGDVWGAMARAGTTRDDRVFALGGGVVGDLAGFAAASYQRGIPVIQIPTTLVAQVDSSLGGKTGVDLPEGKNYIGAYHQPECVIADFATLSTLPPAEYSAGMAEVIKTALISGGPLWDSVTESAAVSSQTIVDCVRTKLGVVAEDERDGGRRQVLNLGHTIGHAIETATGYAVLRHGEAVSIGLMAALRLSGSDSLRQEVRDLLHAAGLPTTISGPSPDEVFDLVSADKKARAGGAVPFVLCEAPGNVSHGHNLEAVEVMAAISEVVI